jgi:GT2 family glycosyltransferase/glycosyltransferase involved in cell wall biosynthesis
LKRLILSYGRRRHQRQDPATDALIIESNLFDRDFYLKNNPDVVSDGVDPLVHYLRRGRLEQRAPSPDFDPHYYLAANPDVAQAGLDPLLHYIRSGRQEGRAAQSLQQAILNSGLFQPDVYRSLHLDVARSGQDPLQHYVDLGRREMRRPSLDFDPNVYLAHNPDLRSPDVDPITHYIRNGRAEGRACPRLGLSNKELPGALAQLRASGLFDEEFYLRQWPLVRDAGVDPLLHYLVNGNTLYPDPSPDFSSAEYLMAHLDARHAGQNPLLHFLNARLTPDPEDDIPAATAHPDDAITVERMRSTAYFNRFAFPFEASDTPGEYVAEAAADLVRRSLNLSIERIEPHVSIIIPVYGQTHFALACLDSLSRHRSHFSVEILVVDDASPEATQVLALQTIPWIRYHRRETNGGFIESCNDAASKARGRYLVFLNSDIRVADGWLDELIGSFELFPNAGLVGSKLYNADGTLQEAGGIYWRDGSAWNYGRNDDPTHPKYCYARQVDYISGASIAVPAHIWRQFDGFDVAYRPAYCEDADLAFRLRHAGYDVWFQPLSQVVHYEGMTHGRDLSSGVKAYQQANMRLLAKRWKSALVKHRPNGQEPDEEANRSARDRILVLDVVTPMPDRDSGSFIIFRMLKALLSLGYQITFVPEHVYLYDKVYTSALQRQGIECIYLPHFGNITSVLDYRRNFDVVLAYRFNVLNQVYDEVCRRLPNARIILHNVDLHFLREEREASLCGRRGKKISAALTKAAELEIMAKVDCTIVHTNVEAAMIQQYLGTNNIVEFPYVAELHPTRAAFEDRCDLMFLGGFSHPPNGDAVKHFVSAIWPLLLPHLPVQARFVIVGHSAPAEIEALASDRVVVVGFVHDLQPYFDSARVFVAPIRYGAGIKGKVIQSLCYGTPSVISSIAAEGIGLVSGKETMIADHPTEFAHAVLNTYFDKNLWHALQSAGYKFIEENFSWQRCLELCNKVLDTADATWLARHDKALRARLRKLTSETQTVDVGRVTAAHN